MHEYRDSERNRLKVQSNTLRKYCREDYFHSKGERAGKNPHCYKRTSLGGGSLNQRFANMPLDRMAPSPSQSTRSWKERESLCV